MKSGIDNLMHVFKSQNTIVNPVEDKYLAQFVEQIASLFVVGSFYYFVLNYVTLKMEYVSEGTKSILGIDSKKFNLERYLDRLHPEDFEHIYKKESASLHFKTNEISVDDITNYKTVYLIRLRDLKGSYKTILHQSRPLIISGEGKIQQTITIHTDVTYLKLPIDNTISFISSDYQKPTFQYKINGNGYIKNNCLKDIFTKREKEIIILLSQGKRSTDIADILCISRLTVETHKSNVLKKSYSKNSVELIAKCLREGLV